MRLSDLTKGGSVFLGVIVAGFLSATYVDERFAKTANSVEPTSDPTASACVDGGGSWKNWPWPNVPALSPKCK